MKKKRGESICLLDCTMKKWLENQQLKAKIVTEKSFKKIVFNFAPSPCASNIWGKGPFISSLLVYNLKLQY